MWKESDYSQKDNDSAIGDSENYSTGEESTHSRRKSSSDEMEADALDMYSRLNAKLGIKVPDCLYKEPEESIENCARILKQNLEKPTTKAPRVIRVVPASVAMANTNGNNKKSEDLSATKDKSSMNLKLHYLLREMKKLRELDKEILDQCLRVNDSIDEVKWIMEEREADLKRCMEDDIIVDDVTTWKEPRGDADMKFAVPVTAPLPSYATLTSVKSSKRVNGLEPHPPNSNNTGYRSYSNPTYAKVDINPNYVQKTEQREAPSYVERQDSYYKRSNPRPVSATHAKQGNPHSGSVWVKQGESHGQRPKSASATSVSVSRKYSNRAKGSVTQRQIREDWIAESSEKQIPEFHKQREYQNLIDLSRVRVETTNPKLPGPRPLPRQRIPVKDVGSAGSRTSSSSLTSSSSASSANSPTRPVSRSSSNKYSRFGVTRQITENYHHNVDISNNNYKSKVVSRKRQPVFPNKNCVVTTSYKRTTSDSVYSWIQSQDDVTYL
uniref:Uncharacterized protein n=1 Tax=Ciona savignyi TaxID=51511 RepID=H2Z4X2_CIOSA